MDRKLQILMLEDNEDDARLIERALRSGGIEFSARRVETREDFMRALDEQHPDVILADFKLPHFDGRSALKLATGKRPDTPVIIVTGTLPDDTAVELLRDGAADYILKDRLSRLAPAIGRALAAAKAARERAATAWALNMSEVRYRRLFESARDGILILEGDGGTIVDANPFLLDLIGYTRHDAIGRRVSEIGAFRDVKAAEEAFVQLQKTDYVRYEHLPLQHKDGSIVDVEVVSNAYPVDGKMFIQCNIRDIRARVIAERRVNEQLDELRLFQKVTVDRELRLREMESELARLRNRAAS